MRTGLFTTTFATLFSALIAIPADTSASPASAYAGCGDDVPQAVSNARARLEADSPLDDRRALICLVQAVEALNRKVEETNEPKEPLRVLVVPGARPETRP